MQTLLDAHHVYERAPGAYLFWLKFPLEMERIMLCAITGALAGLIANRREMIAVTTLAVVQMALFLTAAVGLILAGRAVEFSLCHCHDCRWSYCPVDQIC